MDTLQAIRERRAVKHYDPAFEMPEEDKNKILDCALQALTSL